MWDDERMECIKKNSGSTISRQNMCVKVQSYVRVRDWYDESFVRDVYSFVIRANENSNKILCHLLKNQRCLD